MTKKQLYESLNHVDHSKEKRREMAHLISENKHLIEPLLSLAFDYNNPISMKACWVLEFTAKENLAFIYPHLDVFTTSISKVHFDSSVRPMAKICEYLTKNYFHKKPNKTKEFLSDKHLEKITSACFDWLIGEHKVAAQAYSMTCLLLIGEKNEWVHPELKMILEKNYSRGSSAYKARARLTLAKLKRGLNKYEI